MFNVSSIIRKSLLLALLTHCIGMIAFGQSQPLVKKYPKGANFSKMNVTQETSTFRNNEFLYNMSFDSTVFGPDVAFAGSQFDGWGNFYSAHFTLDAMMDSIHFRHHAYFDRVKIDSLAFFNYAVFDSSAYFISGSFGSQAQFVGSRFSSWVDFTHARFTGAAFFKFMSVGGTANFNEDLFTDQAVFKNATFGDWVDFSNAHFKGFCFFDSVSFSAKSYFDGVTFQSGCEFTHAIFNNDVSFYKTRLGPVAYFDQIKIADSVTLQFYQTILADTLDFSYIPKIGNNIDLTAANFSDSLHYDKKTDTYFNPHYIFFYKTDISKFHLDYIHFRLKLPDMFNGHRFPDDEKEAIYTALLNNFKVSGQENSYQALDIEHQKFRWKRRGASLLTWLPRYWWNFGYDKEYVFMWTIGFILFFTTINFFMVGYLNTKVYALQAVPLLPKVKYIFKSGPPKIVYRTILRRCWYSFIYTSNVFFRLTLDTEKIKFKERWGTGYLFFIYILGVVCLAYMANFVLQKG